MAREKSTKTKKERWVPICPRCDSTDTIIYGAGLGSRYSRKCKNCGYMGTFPEVRASEAPKEPRKPEDFRQIAYHLNAKDVKIIFSALVAGLIIMLAIIFFL